MSTPILNGLPPIPGFDRPWSPTRPLTYEDHVTVARKLEWLSDWIQRWLVDHINEEVAELLKAIDALIIKVNQSLVIWKNEIDAQVEARLDGISEDVENQLATQTAEFDRILQMVINSSIELQIPVLAGIIGGDNIARAAFDARYDRSPRPGWVTGGKEWHSDEGLYNFSARSMPKFMKKLAKAAVDKSERIHICVIGDSKTSSASGARTDYQEAWPAYIRRAMEELYGWGGTGWVPVWNHWKPLASPSTVPSSDDRYDIRNGVGGSVTHWSDQNINMGFWGGSGLRIVSDDLSANEVRFTPERDVDQMMIMMGTSTQRSRLVFTAPGEPTRYYEVAKYYGEPESGVTPSWTWLPLQIGYMRAEDPATGGLRVAKVVLPKKARWTVHVRSYSPASRVDLIACRGIDTSGQVEVSQITQAGRSLNGIFITEFENTGMGGRGLFFDAMQADLSVIALDGFNEWQVATGMEMVDQYKANLRNAIDRQRFSGATGTAGTGRGAAGDVLLVVMPDPDFTKVPAANPGGAIPLSQVHKAVLDIADEKDCAVIDHAWVWKYYQYSLEYYRDTMHGNRYGHADMGLRTAAALKSLGMAKPI